MVARAAQGLRMSLGMKVRAAGACLVLVLPLGVHANDQEELPGLVIGDEP